MPSFPSYYLNNLERKRQRSRDLREGLNEGMAGVLGGVDRLAQMQAALEEKGLRAEALKHGRDIEAANQARADQRFAWEGEDRERKNAQSDQKYWLELQKNATQGNAALGGEPASTPTAPGETSSDVLAKMQGYLGGQEERPGGPQTEEPPPMSVYDLDKAAEVAEEGEPETTTSDIFARLESTLSEDHPMAAPIVPSNADRIEEERLRAAQLKNQILERKATTPTVAPRPKAAPKPAAAPPPVKDDAPDTRTRSRTRSIGAASKILDEIEQAATRFEAATEGPAVGRIVGRARQLATGYVPGFNESERIGFLGNAEALNAMLFPILGREDAPTDPEVKRLEPLMISGRETPDELKSKIATIRKLIGIQESMLPQGAADPPSGGITRRGQESGPPASIPDDDRW